MQVTQFINAKTATGPAYRHALDIIEEIKAGKYKQLVDQLNALPTDSQEQKEFKRTMLPGICFAGTFEARNDNAHLVHSGLVAVDFDHLPPDDYTRHWQLLSQDKHTFALFRSPRRDGIKCITRITPDKDRHNALVRGLRDFYNSPYYDHFEDPSRLCFVSSDPDTFINTEAIPWDKEGKEKKPEPAPRDNVKAGVIPEGQAADVFRAMLRWEANRGMKYQDGNKHKYLISLYAALNRFGVEQEKAIEMVVATFKDLEGVSPVREADLVKRGEYVYKYYNAEHATRVFAPKVKTAVNPQLDEEQEEQPRPRFPVEVFPEDCQNFISELNRTLKYNTDFISIAMMFAVATLNGNKYKLRVKNGWIAPTVFWSMAVGEPGTMKTHPLNSIIKPISLIDKASKDLYDNRMEEWEHNERKGPKPKFNQILISDYTLEALHDIHSYNRRGLGLYKDEIVGFLNDMNKYRKGSDEQFWLESFNNSSYQVNRVSKEPIRIDDIMINVIGTMQPAVLAKVMKDYSGNGLVDRFLFTSAEDAIHPMSMDDMDEEWFDWWKGRLLAANEWLVYNTDKDKVVMEMSPEAKQAMIDADAYFVSLQTSDQETNEIKNYLSKMKTYLPRFALLMNLFDRIFSGEASEVSAHHFKLARQICDYFIASARLLFNDAERTGEIESVAKAKSMNTRAEQVAFLIEKGFKNKDIAKHLKTTPQYVSRIKNEVKSYPSLSKVI